jgi:hypothetical protein
MSFSRELSSSDGRCNGALPCSLLQQGRLLLELPAERLHPVGPAAGIDGAELDVLEVEVVGQRVDLVHAGLLAGGGDQLAGLVVDGVEGTAVGPVHDEAQPDDESEGQRVPGREPSSQ